MKNLLLESLSAAMLRLEDHANLVTLENVDESTFRSFAMAELRRLDPRTKLHTEWVDRVDLLVQRGEENAVIEFKFYVIRPLLDLDGSLIRWKGGAGSKNEEEFRKCLEKMRAFPYGDVHHRFVVLAYETSTEKRTDSFVDLYADLERFKVDRVSVAQHSFAEMECKLIDLS